MKKGVCLNSEVSYVIAKLGHFDTLTIGDAGLPVPDGVQRIDLAVRLGLPGFRDVLETVEEFRSRLDAVTEAYGAPPEEEAAEVEAAPEQKDEDSAEGVAV